MTKNIALCGIDEELASTLECHGEYIFLCFFDALEQRGDVNLAYFLRDGPPVALAVVGYPGAKGLAACDYLRTQDRALPLLWLCDKREFEPRAKRLGVKFYAIEPLATAQFITRLLSESSPTYVGLTHCNGG